MKFSCTQENLHRGLEMVARASGKNAALPILSNVLLKAESTGITLSATNLEIGISCSVRGKVEQPGSYTVQSKLLNDFIALLPDERIDLAFDQGALLVKTDQTQTTLKGIPSEEFPLIPTLERTNPIHVSGSLLRQAITQTIFAAAYDSSRPEISGVFFRVDGKTLVLAATDSYRLAERRIEINQPADPKSAIVPVRALQELLRILDHETEHVELYLSDNQLLVVIGDIELVSRLIEGQYPDYEEILPKDSHTKATLPVAEFTRVIKSASLFCKTGINDVTVSLSPSGEVTVRAANSQLGEHQTSLKGEVQGQATTVIFNYRYLLDGLANLSTDTALLQVSDAESPGLLLPTNEQPYRYLVMPIRQ